MKYFGKQFIIAVLIVNVILQNNVYFYLKKIYNQIH